MLAKMHLHDNAVQIPGVEETAANPAQAAGTRLHLGLPLKS